MKKLVFGFLFLLAFNASASGPKIGVVIVDKLLAEAPQVEAVNADMLKRFSGRKDELKSMETEIKSLQEEYKRNELVMTQDKLDEIKNKVIGKLQVFKQKEVALNQEVSAMRSQKLAELQQLIRTIIQDIAKDDKYDIILSDGVVHATDKYNITDKVLKRMKKDFK